MIYIPIFTTRIALRRVPSMLIIIIFSTHLNLKSGLPCAACPACWGRTVVCSWGGTVSSRRQGDDYHRDQNGNHDLDDHNGDDHDDLLVSSDDAMFTA